MKKILLLLLLLSTKTFSQNSQNESKLNQDEAKAFILKETKEGGKFDFFTPIKGKEYNSSQIKPGIYASNIEVALYKWGKINYELGIEKLDDVFEIFAEYKGRELNEKEKSLIKMGFERELEK
jgi:hypothetical protein